MFISNMFACLDSEPHPHTEAAEKASGFKVGTVKAAEDVRGGGGGRPSVPTPQIPMGRGGLCVHRGEREETPSKAQQTQDSTYLAALTLTQKIVCESAAGDMPS